MTDEISKTIYNLLIAGESIYLPDIGSIAVRRKSAERISSKRIKPPYKYVAFDKQQTGPSLEEHIARIGGFDAEKAHEIYESWLAAHSHDGVIEFAGIGRLEDGIFTPEGSFETLLNPNGTAPAPVSRRRDAVLYIFVATCCLLAVYIFGYIWYDSHGRTTVFDNVPAVYKQPEHKSAEPSLTEQTADAETAKEMDANRITDSAEAEAEATATATATAVAQADHIVSPEPSAQHAHATGSAGSGEVHRTVTSNAVSGEILRTATGRSYVVLGIYSTVENARRAAKQARNAFGCENLQIYHYADKFMVSAYESDSRQECLKYIGNAAKEVGDLWIYTKK